jgi:hypothetical protein
MVLFPSQVRITNLSYERVQSWLARRIANELLSSSQDEINEIGSKTKKNSFSTAMKTTIGLTNQ